VQCPAICWLRVGNCSRRALVGWFLPQLPRVIAALDQGAKLVEVR